MDIDCQKCGETMIDANCDKCGGDLTAEVYTEFARFENRLKDAEKISGTMKFFRIILSIAWIGSAFLFRHDLRLGAYAAGLGWMFTLFFWWLEAEDPMVKYF